MVVNFFPYLEKFCLLPKPDFWTKNEGMMIKKDLDKSTLYEAVKTLVECPESHLHFPQQKLFTLFSVAFQYILFRSTKYPGHYIIRIEDSLLAEKLARKAKDETTRKFMSRLLIPRRLSYGNSTFHLDYFALSSWGVTKDLPQEKIKGAIVVKNTQHTPLIDDGDFRNITLDEQAISLFGKHYYLNSLMEIVPKTITIAFDEGFENLFEVKFPFIEDKAQRMIDGVIINEDINLDD